SRVEALTWHPVVEILSKSIPACRSSGGGCGTVVSTKYNRTGACLLILALSAWATAGCTDATSDSSVASLPAESSASSSEPAGDSSSPSDNSEKDSSGKPKKLETIDDPCADECVKGGSIDV